jgi:hypothetical protein
MLAGLDGFFFTAHVALGCNRLGIDIWWKRSGLPPVNRFGLVPMMGTPASSSARANFSGV